MGTPDGTPEIVVGGAPLEEYDDPNGKTDEDGNIVKKPLLLLQKTEQILVEVEQEKQSNPLKLLENLLEWSRATFAFFIPIRPSFHN